MTRFSQVERRQVSDNEFELLVKWGNAKDYQESFSGTLDGLAYQIYERKPDISCVVLFEDVFSLSGKKLASRTDVVQNIQGLDVRHLKPEVVGFLLRTLVAAGISYRVMLTPLDIRLEEIKSLNSNSGVLSWARGFFSSSTPPTPSGPPDDGKQLNQEGCTQSDFENEFQRLNSNMEEDPLSVLCNSEVSHSLADSCANKVLSECAKHLALLCFQFLQLEDDPLSSEQSSDLHFSTVSQKQGQSYQTLLSLCTLICAEFARNTVSSSFHFGLLLSHKRPKHIEYVKVMLLQSLQLYAGVSAGSNIMITPACHAMFRESYDREQDDMESTNAENFVVIRQTFAPSTSSSQSDVKFFCKVLAYSRSLLDQKRNPKAGSAVVPLCDLPDRFVDFCCTIAPYFMVDPDPKWLFFLACQDPFVIEQSLFGDITRARASASTSIASPSGAEARLSAVSNVQTQLFATGALAAALRCWLDDETNLVSVAKGILTGSVCDDLAEGIVNQVLLKCEQKLREKHSWFETSIGVYECCLHETKQIVQHSIENGPWKSPGDALSALSISLKFLLCRSTKHLVMPSYVSELLMIPLCTRSDMVGNLYLAKCHLTSLSSLRRAVLCGLLELLDLCTTLEQRLTSSTKPIRSRHEHLVELGQAILNGNEKMTALNAASKCTNLQSEQYGKLLGILVSHRSYLFSMNDEKQSVMRLQRIRVESAKSSTFDEGIVLTDESSTDGEAVWDLQQGGEENEVETNQKDMLEEVGIKEAESIISFEDVHHALEVSLSIDEHAVDSQISQPDQ